MRSLTSQAVIIILLLIDEGISTAKFNKYKPCKCEDLIYESECDQNSHCTFEFGICLSKPCNQLKKRDECFYNEKCGWYQNECQKFDSCTKFENSEDCQKYNLVCVYNYQEKQCSTYDKAYLNKCSEYNLEFCFQAKEGACQVLDGKCQKVNECSELKSSLMCSNFGYSCLFNFHSNTCESIMGCENTRLSWGNCRQASTDIQSYIYYICQRYYEWCEDWALDEQTVETCHDYSRGYYHWTGYDCVPCFQVILLMTNIIVLSIL